MSEAARISLIFGFWTPLFCSSLMVKEEEEEEEASVRCEISHSLKQQCLCLCTFRICIQACVCSLHGSSLMSQLFPAIFTRAVKVK